MVDLSSLSNASNSQLLFSGIFLFMWIMYLFEMYLNARQRKNLITLIEQPSETHGLMDAETYEKSRVYNLDKSNFSWYKSWYTQLETSLILLYNVLPWLWSVCERHAASIAASFASSAFSSFIPDTEMIASMLFITYASIFSFVDGLPWGVYRAFWLEARHGFNKQTPHFFAIDQVKGVCVSLVLSLPITYGLLRVIQWGGAAFYVYAWAFCFVVTLFLMFVYPEWIAPLFDKYIPLPDGELKLGIQALADRVAYPLRKTYIVEGSKRSNHSNAYLYGFWSNKRIVLFDTLLQPADRPSFSDATPEKKVEAEAETNAQTEKSTKTAKSSGCTNAEICAIIGHELGHWKCWHVVCHLVISQLNLFAMFFTFGILYGNPLFFEAFGFAAALPAILIRLVVILQFVMAPYHELLNFLVIQLTRKFEYQADQFSTEELGCGSELMSSLIKLQKDNLSFPISDWLYSAFYHSHPTVLERKKAIQKMMDAANKKKTK